MADLVLNRIRILKTGLAVVSQADRLFGIDNLSDEDLCRLEAQDFKHNELMIE